MLLFIIGLIIFGLVAGVLARALVPGPDPMSAGATILLGLAGSFIGGFLGWTLFGTDFEDGALQPAGLLGAVLGSVIALFLVRALDGQGRRSQA